MSNKFSPIQVLKEAKASETINQIKAFIRDRFGINKRILLMITSAIVGIIVAFIAIGLGAAIEYVSKLTFLNPLLHDYQFLMPAVGGLLIGLIIFFAKKEKSQGGGVEDTIKFIRMTHDTMRLRDIIVRFITSALSLGTGASAGKEAPVVHLGGGIGATIGKFLRFPDSFIKTLTGAGVAAGIAAAFQAPIAGSFFALEILLASFTLDTFSMIIVAAVTSSAIAQKFGHITPHIHVAPNIFENPLNLIFFVLLGISGGVVTVLFIKSLQASENLFSRLQTPRWSKPAIGGLLLGAIALYFPGMLGEGYAIINLLLTGNFNELFYYTPNLGYDMVWWALLITLLVKVLATSVTIGSGSSGGTIVPALFIGTNLGALAASIAAILMPDVEISRSTWVLVGMSSVLAPMTQAPIFSIMLFFELTKSYEVILPVLIVVSISILICRHYLNGSLYSVSLQKEGIRLYRGMEQSVMETIQVKEISHSQLNLINQNVTLTSILNGFFHSPFMAGFVIDKDERYMGMITLENVKKYIKNQPLCDLLLASQTAQEPDTWVLPEDSVLHALELMDKTDAVLVPVLENAKTRKPVAYITRKDIISVYNRQVIKRGTQSILIEKDGTSEMKNYLQVGNEFQIHTLQIPKPWHNKTLKELDFRAKYNLTVIGLKKESEISFIIPDINYRFKRNECITVVGTQKDIETMLHDISKSGGLIDLLRDKWKPS